MVSTVFKRRFRAAFPDGLRVVVTSGQYAGDRGEVVHRDPDLRPGSVWVTLTAAGTRLVPGFRLAPAPERTGPTPTGPTTFHAEPTISR